MSEASERIEPHQMFAKFIETIAAPARRVAVAPHDFPKKPDLIAELTLCACEFQVVSEFLSQLGYPKTASQFAAAAARVNTTVAKAMEFGQ